MTGFYASIVSAFIPGVELFDYVLDRGMGGESARTWLRGESQMGNKASR